MVANEEIMQVLKDLARSKSTRILPLPLVYKTLIKQGIYSSADSISKALKRLEVSGLIKPVAFGVSIELVGSDEEYKPLEVKELVQTTL